MYNIEVAYFCLDALFCNNYFAYSSFGNLVLLYPFVMLTTDVDWSAKFRKWWKMVIIETERLVRNLCVNPGRDCNDISLNISVVIF